MISVYSCIVYHCYACWWLWSALSQKLWDMQLYHTF